MTKKEHTILEEAIKSRRGLYSPSDMINGIAKQDHASVQGLVVKGYLQEVPQDMPGIHPGSTYSVTFYRLTEKGLLHGEPLYKKIWFHFRGDVRTVLVSVVTALLTTLITILLARLFNR